MATTFEALLLAQQAFVLNPPVAVLTQGSATTSLAANSWTPVAFDTASPDTYLGHSNTNPTRYTSQVAAYYSLSGGVSIASNSGSSRGARFAKNGSAIQGSQQLLPPSAAFPTTLAAIPILIYLNVGDYVEIHGFPGTSTLSTNIGTDGSTSSLTVTWGHS